MAELGAGWLTELDVLVRSGSTVEERGDHLVVRTPANPTFHRGNCLVVTDGAQAGDAGRWVAEFRSAFPQASWLAVGLTRLPEDAAAWAAHGVELEAEEVLGLAAVPHGAPLPEPYTVRQLAGGDWEQTVALAVAENARSERPHPAETHERFERARAEANRSLCAGGGAAYFGAFAGGTLVAQLGIVCCGEVARYQNVLTDESHRRRGLAAHLVGVAGEWAARRGCRQWVIVTEETNPAGRVYRRAGFAPRGTMVQAYRR
jgi:GNAT superfamily N-acetyltransferase